MIISPCANLCRFDRDVIDPALLAQSSYEAMAVQHGYSRINASRTALTLQVELIKACAGRGASQSDWRRVCPLD